MITGGSQKPTDICVLEQRYGDRWVPMTYIGPDRLDIIFNPTLTLKGGSMRVRYFRDE